MNPTLKLSSLETLSQSKQLRRTRLNTELSRCRAETARAQEAQTQAQSVHSARAAAHENGCAQLVRLRGAERLQPQDVAVQELVLADLKAAWTRAALDLTNAADHLAQCHAKEASVLFLINRLEVQLKRMNEVRDRLVQERFNQQESSADEESEEAAMARRLRQRREAAWMAHTRARAGKSAVA